MKRHLIRITEDLFDVASAIEHIDEGNFVVYNAKAGRFEVHNRYNLGDSLSLVIPYLELDYRAIELTQKTRRANADKLFAQLDADNSRLEKNGQSALLQQMRGASK